MKKIAYIYDNYQMYFNSVSDILHNMSRQLNTSEYEQIVISTPGMLTRPLTTETFRGLKTYLPMSCPLKDLLKNADFSAVQKLSCLLNSMIGAIASKIPRVKHLYKAWACNQYYDKIFQIEKPDLVIYFSLTHRQGFPKTCKKRNIPYISMLYDTFVSNPCVTRRDLEIENEEIANAIAYFVPSFFIQDYRKHYGYSNIYPFNLPLLIPQDKVIEAYDHPQESLKFTYFGLLQVFRNADRIKEIFRNLGEALDIFSAGDTPSDETYIFHQPIQQEQLYRTVASSDFLVAFDNSEPYAHYLPSKAYLYVSFTKPIIVFGDNEDSALKQFLNGYPSYYYHNINDPSLEGLQAFIKANQAPAGFDKQTYARYADYLPQPALCDIVTLIQNTLDNKPTEAE